MLMGRGVVALEYRGTSDCEGFPVPMEPTSDLYRAERKSRWYSEDNLCWNVACIVWGVLMAVLKRHTPTPTPEEKAHLAAKFLITSICRVIDLSTKGSDYLALGSYATRTAPKCWPAT